MKKIFSALTIIAACAVLAVSCDDTKTNDNNTQPAADKYRVKTYSLVGDGWADVYQYTYDAAGKVTRIFREEGKDYNITYSGENVTIKNGTANYAEIVLNSAGYVAKMTDEWGDVREYTYDSKGHMIESKKNGTVASTIVLATECIVTWTRMKDDAIQTKKQTYTDKPNTNGIHNIHSEATDPSRWLFETGMFGKASIYLCESSKWEHSDIGATYAYDIDANGCVTKETKNYGGEMEYFEYTWEKL